MTDELIRELQAQSAALTSDSLAADPTVPRRLYDLLADAVPSGDDAEEQAQACAALAAALDHADVTVTSLDLGDLRVRWRGDVATEATNVLASTRDLARSGSTAMVEARGHVLAYVSALEAIRNRVEAERLEMAAVAAALTDDPERVRSPARRLGRALDDSIEALAEAGDAEATLRARLADVTAQARMRDTRPGGTATIPAEVAVRVAAAGMNLTRASGIDDGILSTHQLRRLGDFLDRMPAGQRERVLDLVALAPSDTHAAYVMKAVAAGRAAEVEDFAGRINGESDEWVRNHLGLIGPEREDFDVRGARQERLGGVLFGTDVEQFDERTCGPAVAVMALAMNDPIYALELTDGPESFNRALDAEVERVYERLRGQPPSPENTDAVRAFNEGGGVTTQALVGEMNRHQGVFGTELGLMDVPPESQDKAWDRVVAAVDQGHPAAVVLVDEGVSGHVLLAVAHDGDTLLCWDPQEGRMVRFDGFSDDDVRTAALLLPRDLDYGEVRQVAVPER